MIKRYPSNTMIRNDFQDYAELCYRSFGDRVKHWITLNEPYTFSTMGYTYGICPPGRCSKWWSEDCIAGDSGTEPYLVSHHQLLAHAAAVKVYRDKYQVSIWSLNSIKLGPIWLSYAAFHLCFLKKILVIFELEKISPCHVSC